jgi:hypothetical protein
MTNNRDLSGSFCILALITIFAGYDNNIKGEILCRWCN